MRYNTRALETIKNHMKLLAQEIHDLKEQRKKSIFGYVRGLHKKQVEYRIRHVAICELLGTNYCEIEPHHKRHSNGQLVNPIDRNRVNEQKDQYRNMLTFQVEDISEMSDLEVEQVNLI